MPTTFVSVSVSIMWKKAAAKEDMLYNPFMTLLR